MTQDVRYVIDDHAVLSIPSLCEEDGFNPTLDILTDFVSSGWLCFPDQVVHDCAKLATGEGIHTWIKAVATGRPKKRVPSMWQEEALGMCEDLVDYDDEGEQGSVLVAAMALMLSQDEPDCTLYVVTEDRSNLPTRRCLHEACGDLGLQSMSALDFLKEIVPSSYLV
jgi:hypothetical protein